MIRNFWHFTRIKSSHTEAMPCLFSECFHILNVYIFIHINALGQYASLDQIVKYVFWTQNKKILHGWGLIISELTRLLVGINHEWKAHLSSVQHGPLEQGGGIQSVSVVSMWPSLPSLDFASVLMKKKKEKKKKTPTWGRLKMDMEDREILIGCPFPSLGGQDSVTIPSLPRNAERDVQDWPSRLLHCRNENAVCTFIKWKWTKWIFFYVCSWPRVSLVYSVPGTPKPLRPLQPEVQGSKQNVVCWHQSDRAHLRTKQTLLHCHPPSDTYEN